MNTEQKPAAPFAVVVNDDPTQLAVLAGLVRKANLESRAFMSAEDALVEMTSLAGDAGGSSPSLPDLVVTDLYMPGIDGWHFCRLLRSPEYASLNQIPILVVSATYSGDEPERIAADLGVEGFLAAPVAGLCFVKRVEEILTGKKMNKPLRALIVEENSELTDELEKAFGAHGYQVHSASNCRDALDMLAKTACDVAVISHNLPDASGDAVIEAAHKSRPDCVFIMMTSDPNPALALAWAKKGAAAYLQKPFDPEYLIDLCARARRERSLLRVQDLLEERTLELRATEQIHRTILRTAIDGFWLVDMQGNILEVNEAYCRMSGYSEQELLSMKISDLEAVETADDVEAHSRKIVAQGKDRFESRQRRKDGTIFDVEVSVQYRPLSDGRLIAFLRDITDCRRAEEERVKLEAQLHQAMKMEAVGRLAGGVAHDFNNMLGVILGRTDLALRYTEPEGRPFAHLQEIKKAAERSADLIRQLLAFARKQAITPRALDLNASLEGSLKMLTRLIGEDIEFVWLPASAPCPVKLDPSQLDQVLANLCVNARDAIEGTGKVIIETGNVSFDEEYCKFHPDAFPGDYVFLSVSDTGCGMEKDVLDQVFEPFFTTKEQGRGTGLGLATVYGVVKQNKGFINVYSEPGSGTTFKICLPRHQGKAEQLCAAGLSAPAVKGCETILLVEDEPTNLEMAKAMLEALGYRVVPAATPGDALRLAEKYAGGIDLLVTDVIMPEMDGRDLAKNLLVLYPNLKRLFMSGYTADVIARSGVLDPGINFIQKPFSMKDIADKIREALADFED